jgi:hypothetical protein
LNQLRDVGFSISFTSVVNQFFHFQPFVAMIEFTFKKDELKDLIAKSADEYVNISVTVNFDTGVDKVFPATILATLAKADSRRSTAPSDSVRGCPIPPNCT